MTNLQAYTNDKTVELNAYIEERVGNLIWFLLNNTEVPEGKNWLAFNKVEVNLNAYSGPEYPKALIQIPVLPMISRRDLTQFCHTLNTQLMVENKLLLASADATGHKLNLGSFELNKMFMDYVVLNQLIEYRIATLIEKAKEMTYLFEAKAYLDELLSITDKLYISCENWIQHGGGWMQGKVIQLEHSKLCLDNDKQIDLLEDWEIRDLHYITDGYPMVLDYTNLYVQIKHKAVERITQMAATIIDQ